VLILEGEQDADRVMSTAFQDSARKFGLEVVDVRPFVLSNDPRVRDETNIPLLTGDADYDVVFLADTLGEFGRYVPYHTYDPRPVVGSEGLVASAWHWTWERQPQLNQRFDRIAERPMTDTDYAAWAAVRSAVEAMVRTESREIPVLRAYLTDDAFRHLQGRARQLPPLGQPAAPGGAAAHPQRRDRPRAAGGVPAPDQHPRHPRPRPAGNGLPLRVMPEVMRQEAESVFCLSVAKLPV
jgi:hypothetical protein